MNTARLKILLHRAGAVLALAGIGFVSLRLYNYSAAMDFSALGAGAWTALAVCAALYGLAGLLMAKAWHSILRHLNLNVSTAWAVQAFGISQLAKYIPGNIFHFAGRQAMGMAKGLPALPLLRSTVWDLASQYAAGILFIFPAMPAYLPGMPTFVGVVAFILAVAASLFLVRRFADAFIMAAFCSHLIFLTLSGLTFSVVLQVSLGGQMPDGLARISVCGAFILAWLIGGVTPGAPAGAGVREMVLLFLFNGRVPEGPLLMAILLSRGVTVVGDVVFYLLANGVAFARRYRGGAGTD